MIFDLNQVSRIKNQNQWLKFDSNQISNQKSKIRINEVFFGFRLVYLEIRIADMKIYRSQFGWKKNMEKINFHIMPKGFPEKFSFRDSNLL